MSATKSFTEADFVRVTQAATNATLSGNTLVGALVESSTSGTLTITDSPQSAGSRTVVNALPLTAGAYVFIPARCVGNIVVTVGGTGSIVLFYNKD
jgi:hypothetical protein